MNPIKFHFIIRKRRLVKYLRSIPQRIFWGKDYERWVVQYNKNVESFERWDRLIRWAIMCTNAQFLRNVANYPWLLTYPDLYDFYVKITDPNYDYGA